MTCRGQLPTTGVIGVTADGRKAGDGSARIAKVDIGTTHSRPQPLEQQIRRPEDGFYWGEKKEKGRKGESP